MNKINLINNIIDSILTIMISYNIIYYAIGLFFTRKFKPAKRKHKYGIVIAARNEEKVIGNLLDSINKQDYPKNLITTFVVADNCTDKTAEIAKSHGAIVYERFDNKNKTKGYALQYLFKKIKKDYEIKSFEGYFIFDADNLLKKNYISKMNNAFDSGEKIITSYRNTKNFDENWIANSYAIHWLRSIRTRHRARSVLRLATNIQGTGFLFTNEIVKNGWNYTGLTEDRALTADAVAQGYQITYQDEAEFFDEQPTKLKIALRQRLRWSKGHILAFLETGPKLLMNIIFGKRKTKNNNITKYKKISFKNRILESIRHRFASYDTLVQLTPLAIINLVHWLIVSVIAYTIFAYNEGLTSNNILTDFGILSKMLVVIIGKESFKINNGIKAAIVAFILSIIFKILTRISIYITNMINALYVFIIERNRIKKIPFYKKIIYTLTWPTFDLIGTYTTYAALFTKVSWKPIPHESKITIEDIN